MTVTKELFDTRPKVSSRRLNILPLHEEQADSDAIVGPGRFPPWLHRKLPKGGGLWQTGKIVDGKRLHTVCEEAQCPNMLDCWSSGTATFLVMGKECTRACGFCDIDTSKNPKPLEADEPLRVAESVKELGLKHAVITMVARDDLTDGGAAHLALIVEEIRRVNPNTTIEVLASDLEGNLEALSLLLDTHPDIFNHNIETVRSYTPRVRHKATYDRTLSVLAHAKKHSSGVLVKSGLMVGLGETEEMVQETLRDLASVGVNIVTIGQYLQPNRHKLLVKRFVHPEEFQRYEAYGKSLGIGTLYCGPFVRSSYNAGLVLERAQGRVVIDSK